jgi:hypothetical protein
MLEKPKTQNDQPKTAGPPVPIAVDIDPTATGIGFDIDQTALTSNQCRTSGTAWPARMPLYG